MKKDAMKNLAAVLSMALAMLMLQTAAIRAEISLKDKYQQNYNFSKIRSIVVLPFSETYKSARNILSKPANSKDIIAESVDVFSMELFDAGINVIDRTLLDKVLSEQKMSLSGLMENDDYQKIGKLVNADAILWGSISLVRQIGRRQAELSVRLIDVGTGTVVYTSIGEKSDIWGARDVTAFKKELMSEASKKLAEFLKKSR